MNIHTNADRSYHLELVIDWKKDGNISIDEVHESMNGQTFYLAYGFETAYQLPDVITEDDYVAHTEELKPLIKRVIAGYDEKWNGNNRVAKFTEDACAAMEKIEAVIEGWQWDDVPMFEAQDFLSDTLTPFDEDGDVCRYDRASEFKVEIDEVTVVFNHQSDLSELEDKIAEEVEKCDFIVRGVEKYLEELQNICQGNYEAIEKEITEAIEEDEDAPKPAPLETVHVTVVSDENVSVLPEEHTIAPPGIEF